MDYEFIHDRQQNRLQVIISDEQQVLGQWLQDEVGLDMTFVNRILACIEEIKRNPLHDCHLQRRDWELQLDRDEARLMYGGSDPDDIPDDGLKLNDGLLQAAVGLEDFEALLRSWLNFTGALERYVVQ